MTLLICPEGPLRYRPPCPICVIRPTEPVGCHFEIDADHIPVGNQTIWHSRFPNIARFPNYQNANDNWNADWIQLSQWYEGKTPAQIRKEFQAHAKCLYHPDATPIVYQLYGPAQRRGLTSVAQYFKHTYGHTDTGQWRETWEPIITGRTIHNLWAE